MINDFELMEQLLARYSHDLSGPIGAVSNGVEFLEEEKHDMRDQAIKLISNSARESVVRLQFYRQAYGIVPIHGEANLQRLKSVTEALLETTKIRLEWPDEYLLHMDMFVGHKFGKLIMNMMIVCIQTLIYGGTISVKLYKPNNQHNSAAISLLATANQLKVDPEIFSILQKGHNISLDDLNSRNVQPLFLMRLAHYIKADIMCEYHDKSFKINAQQTLDG